MLANLNKINIDGDVKWQRLTTAKTSSISVYFDNLEQRLREYIVRSEICLGCVAWLTNENILNALSGIHKVSILVQKEDFLRPDSGSNKKLKKLYDDLPGFTDDDLCPYGGCSNVIFPQENESTVWADEEDEREVKDEYLEYPFNNPVILSTLSSKKRGVSRLPFRSITYCKGGGKAIRCVGNLNTDKSPAMPRMHHKFMLFCDENAIPFAVWTGSFNFTQNGTKSLENAIVINEPDIVAAYWQEWAYVYALSEDLNWMQKWCSPDPAEWRS